MLDRFAMNLDQNLVELSSSRFVFDFKELKCMCRKKELKQMINGSAGINGQLLNKSLIS